MAQPISQTLFDDKAVFTFAPIIYQSAGANLTALLTINGVALSNLTAFSDGILQIPALMPNAKKCKITFYQQTYVRIALLAGGFVTIDNPNGQSNSFALNPGQEYLQIDGATYKVPITHGTDVHDLDFTPKTIAFPATGFMYRGGISNAYDAASWPPIVAATHVVQVYITPKVEIY